MVSTEIKIRMAFLVLAVILWYATMELVDNQTIEILVLLSVGVIAPRIVEAWREKESA